MGKGEALILRNHGLLIVGKSMGEAFNWIIAWSSPPRTVGRKGQPGANASACPEAVLKETWKITSRSTRRPYGVIECTALLRKLDRIDPGYAT